MKNLNKILILLLIPLFVVPSFADSGDDIDMLYEKGLDAVRDGSFSDALSYFDKVLEKDPKHLDALANKAGMLIQLEKYDEANIVLDKSFLLDSNHKGALNNKAIILYFEEKFPESEIYFDKVLDIDPNNVYALTIKSQLLINQDKISQANELVDKALSINPNYLLALSLKADILLKNGEEDEGLEYLKKIIELNPSLLNYYTREDDSSIKYKNTKGSAEFKLNDSHGNLVGFIQTKKIKILEHEVTNLALDEWESHGEIKIEETNYEIFKIEKTFHIETKKTAGRTGLGISLDNNENITTGFAQQLWIVLSIHPQYFAEEGDTMTVYFTVLRPIT